MLLAAYNWSPSQFEKKLEYRMHWLIFVLAIMLAAVPLFFGTYNPSCGTCAVRTLPRWCGEGLYGDGTTECIRGNATVSDMFTFILFLFIIAATVFSTGSMLVIYRSVYKQEQVMAGYSFGSTEQENHARSKRLRKSMLLYTGSFYVCWVLPAILIYTPNTPRTLYIFGRGLVPLMGFFNMLVFIRPFCVKYQREHAGTHLLVAYYHVMVGTPLATVSVMFGTSLAAVRHWITSRRGAGQDADGPGTADGGIGPGRHKKKTETRAGSEAAVPASAAARGEHAPADGAPGATGGEDAPTGGEGNGVGEISDTQAWF